MRAALLRQGGREPPTPKRLDHRVRSWAMTMSSKIAVIGMACRFPGDIDNTDKYWRTLLDGRNLCGDIPQNRWNANRFYHPGEVVPGKSYVRRGHFMNWDYER